MFALVAALLVGAPQNIISVGGGAALTLPAARHVVRLDPQNGKPATWLLAVQQDGAAGHWLSMYRSTDEGQSWHWYAPIQDACCERDTSDLVQIGMDVAMVFSYEGPGIGGSAAHDVYFQWWRWNGNADWVSQPAIKVFDSTSSATAYLRGELAVDSAGRLWVWAQRLNSDGTFTGVISVSADGGATFQAQPALDTFADRPGGRIMPVGGNRLMLLYGTHGVDPGYMRLRNDSDAVSSWGARQLVFSDGIYHGAALSAAVAVSGGVHLLYKDVNEQLWYRHWSGSWSARQLVESSSDWALQPAITRVGGSLVIFWNRMLSTSNYQFYTRVLENGSLGSPKLLDGTGGFKGYPASVETLPETVPQVPCLYGSTPDANSSGSVALVFAPVPNGGPPPPPPPPPPSGSGSGTLFSDDFNRTSGLGPGWLVLSGLWRAPGTRADSDLDGADQIAVQNLSCADCSVQARVINFGAGIAALNLRQSASNDRYDLALLPDGRLQIRRTVLDSTVVLAQAASGVADLGSWTTIALRATGSGPVQLVASVNGVVKLTVSDAAASAIVAPGTAGMSTNIAGIPFDDFVVTGFGGGSGDGGVDGGTPDAGTPDAGVPDAGTPDAGVPDAGPPDAGSPQSSVLFSDDFNRTLTSGLGPGWTIVAGLWRDNQKANSDLDALDRAAPAGVTCADCRVDARTVNFAAGESMLELRSTGSDRYALALTAAGRLEIRRYRGGGLMVLGSVPSGIGELDIWHSLSFSASGGGPVTLNAWVDGVPKLSVTDTSTSALAGPGAAGIAATTSGIPFEDFALTATPRSP